MKRQVNFSDVFGAKELFFKPVRSSKPIFHEFETCALAEANYWITGRNYYLDLL